jgi:hypothetical protein
MREREREKGVREMRERGKEGGGRERERLGRSYVHCVHDSTVHLTAKGRGTRL